MTDPTQLPVAIEHVKVTLTPTIMQCSLGGFIVSIPGRGSAAKSTFEEAIQFLSQEAHKECFGRGKDLPKVVRDLYKDFPVSVQATAAVLGVSLSLSILSIMVHLT